jgi:serine/threonine protein kinase
MLPATTAVDTFRKHCQAQKIPDDATDLLAQMLSLDPSNRPSSVECLRHVFFQNSPAPMSSEEFLAATSQFTSSHEFVVKNRAGKRGRVDVDQRGGTSHKRVFGLSLRVVPAELTSNVQPFKAGLTYLCSQSLFDRGTHPILVSSASTALEDRVYRRLHRFCSGSVLPYA